MNTQENIHTNFIMKSDGYPIDKIITSESWSMMSPITKLENIDNKDAIILFTQFYIDKNKKRLSEMVKCLQLNIDNELINKIYLVNERIYTDNEMHIANNSNKSKIEQINHGTCLKYNDIFNIIDNKNINGYVIIANSDIFFDKSLLSLYKSGLEKNKKIYSQLRFEYTNPNLDKCPVFGSQEDSHDTWIFHSNFNIEKSNRKIFNFQLDIPGCDNHIIYLFMILGYAVHNEPFLIKSYHNHTTPVSNYTNSTKILEKPCIRLIPVLQNYSPYTDTWWRFNILEENNHLRNYLTDKFENNKHFIIPRIAGVENNFAQLGMTILQKQQASQQASQQEMSYIQQVGKTMKNNAGINITSVQSVIKYSQLYLAAFHKCDMYFEWEPWGDVYKYIANSHNFINMNFKQKQRFWAFTLDIFHNIYNDPWTIALKGKRILIISPFIKSFQEKIPIRKEIYGVDLFPDCSFVFLKPPQTQGDCPSEEFDKELDKFVEKISTIKDDFDVALCSCGGYGNLVCSKIYDMGKSSIYVGGVLQMYFGVYGSRWMRERADILRLFMNKHWSRPKEEEQPDGFKKVEGSCYW